VKDYREMAKDLLVRGYPVPTQDIHELIRLLKKRDKVKEHGE